MRTLKYAILGLLNREALTGHDIARKFSQELASFWSAKHSQIDPELSLLAREGLVHCQTVAQGEGLRKKLYTITPAGKQDFAHWMRENEPLEPTPKDIFKLKAYYSEALSFHELLVLFEQQLQKRREKLNLLQKHMDQQYSKESSVSGVRCGDYMVPLAAVMQENAYVDWLELCIGRLSDMG